MVPAEAVVFSANVPSPKNILPVTAAAPSLDPEDGITIFRFHQEGELYLQFLRAPGEVEDFLRLCGQILQIGTQSGERLLQSQEFVAVFLHQLTPVFESETAIAGRQQGKEERRPLAQALQRARYRS